MHAHNQVFPCVGGCWVMGTTSSPLHFRTSLGNDGRPRLPEVLGSRRFCRPPVAPAFANRRLRENSTKPPPFPRFHPTSNSGPAPVTAKSSPAWIAGSAEHGSRPRHSRLRTELCEVVGTGGQPTVKPGSSRLWEPHRGAQIVLRLTHLCKVNGTLPFHRRHPVRLYRHVPCSQARCGIGPARCMPGRHGPTVLERLENTHFVPGPQRLLQVRPG